MPKRKTQKENSKSNVKKKKQMTKRKKKKEKKTDCQRYQEEMDERVKELEKRNKIMIQVPIKLPIQILMGGLPVTWSIPQGSPSAMELNECSGCLKEVYGFLRICSPSVPQGGVNVNVGP